MEYTIKAVAKIKDRPSDYGTMTDYMLTFDNGEAAQLSQKQTTPAPVEGSKIEGAIEQSTWGPKFKKVQKAFGGGGGRQQDPEVQNYIIRQNALTNAVAYVLGKAAYMKQPEALEFISGKEIIQVATYFSAYSRGKVTVTMTPDEIAKEFGYDSPVKTQEEGIDLEEPF